MRLVLPAIIFVQFLTILPSYAQTKVRVNWGALSGVMSGIWVAYEEGLFKKNGLDVELLHIPSTSRAIQSMLAGEIQFTTADALNSVQAVMTGADLVMVCEGINRFVFSLMVGPKSKESPSSRGKKSASLELAHRDPHGHALCRHQSGAGSERLYYASVG